MATSQEFNQGLRTIAEYAEKIGDDIVQDISGQTDQGASIDGYECQHGDHSYQIIGTQVWDHVVVRYPYNISEQLATMRAVANAGQQAQTQGVQVDEQDIKQATEDIRDQVTDDEIQNVRIELIDLIGVPGFAPNLSTDQDLVTGFTIDKKLFPYREGFTITEFEDAVQGVVTLGWKGKSLLDQRYHIDEFADELGLDSESTEPDGLPGDDVGRGFE